MQSRSSRVTEVVVIGGGAAGIFGAISAATCNPQAKILLLEKTNTLLAKVKISGGGRCNVTHACFDPKILIQSYPRGSRELLGPFTRFQPQDMISWLEKRGVQLKAEKDGRVFPTTNSSQTIIDCFLQEAHKLKIEIRLQSHIEKIEKSPTGFQIHLTSQELLQASHLLLATGSSSGGHTIARDLGHTIVPPVPSLFTFHSPLSPLKDLSGVAVDPVTLKIPQTSLVSTGPLLITHFGFSGPAVLKLSAWGARVLHATHYVSPLHISWTEDKNPLATLLQLKSSLPQQTLQKTNPFHLPSALWKRFLILLNIDPTKTWMGCSHKELNLLTEKLQRDIYEINGKTPNKEEFVTCGGVELSEVNFKTMESKITPGLYFAGEVLNIDGVTGGYNFQSAWTTSWIAGASLST